MPLHTHTAHHSLVRFSFLSLSDFHLTHGGAFSHSLSFLVHSLFCYTRLHDLYVHHTHTHRGHTHTTSLSHLHHTHVLSLTHTALLSLCLLSASTAWASLSLTPSHLSSQSYHVLSCLFSALHTRCSHTFSARIITTIAHITALATALLLSTLASISHVCLKLLGLHLFLLLHCCVWLSFSLLYSYFLTLHATLLSLYISPLSPLSHSATQDIHTLSSLCVASYHSTFLSSSLGHLWVRLPGVLLTLSARFRGCLSWRTTQLLFGTHHTHTRWCDFTYTRLSPRSRASSLSLLPSLSLTTSAPLSLSLISLLPVDGDLRTPATHTLSHTTYLLRATITHTPPGTFVTTPILPFCGRSCHTLLHTPCFLSTVPLSLYLLSLYHTFLILHLLFWRSGSWHSLL